MESPQITEAVLKAMTSAKGDLMPVALDYFESVQDKEEYLTSLSALFGQGNSDQRLLLIESLSEFEDPPMALLTKIGETLSEIESYQEVHRFLTYLEEQEISTEGLLESIAKLLEHPKFFFSRRAYWFLEKQDLPESLQKKAAAFKEAHGDRL